MRDFAGRQQQKAYQDKVAGADFLEFLRKRIILLREVLADDGSFYLHLDNRRAHYAKVLLDEIFGEQNFRNAIAWKRSDAHSDVSQGATHYGRVYDTIFYYVKSGAAKLNGIFTELPQSTIDKWYRHVEEGTGRRYNMGDASGPGGAIKGNPYFEWNGVKRYWRFSPERMKELERENRLAYSSTGVAYVKRYLDESKGVPIQDWWDDIPMLRGIHQGNESLSYPTQKPEKLLERILLCSSQPGDLVLDAFAGSGTTLAVAEKLGRRWIGIDCGKLSIYTIQKRLLSLKKEVGNTGAALTPKPFTLYNAGLYDFSKLRELPWEEWRFFALQLFQCRDEPHTVGGIRLDGRLKGASVLVFNHLKQKDARVDEQTIESLHEALGSRVGTKMFIIAPAMTFDFQQDFIDLEGVRYYALRIPYSIISELHSRAFTALKQPSDELAVNETVEAVGFDFIRTPEVTIECRVDAKNARERTAIVRITSFRSEAILRDPERKDGMESLSMVMLDLDFEEKNQIFDLDEVLYAGQIADDGWELRFPFEKLGERMMAVFIDTYGNEARVVIPRNEFAVSTRKLSAESPRNDATTRRSKGVQKRGSGSAGQHGRGSRSLERKSVRGVR
ncbi:MAG: site-specific DNA-methyltransferase [Myxococcaceae bacterium]